MKKILALVACLSLVASLAVGGSIAYLTDRDSASNVFTMGNVEIDLTETFDQLAELLPGEDIAKEPIITNTGDNTAWVWATIAFPAAFDSTDASQNAIHFNYESDYVNDKMWTWMEADKGWICPQVVIKGVTYNLYTVLYQTALEPNDSTEPVMTNVYMDANIDIAPDGTMYRVENGNVTEIDWNINDNGYPTIYVSAYAIQETGFDTVQAAYKAYNDQWGENGTEYADNSFEIGADTEKMKDALAAGGTIAVTDDIEVGRLNADKDTEADIDLQDNTMTGTMVNEGDLSIKNGTMESKEAGIENSGTATLENVTMNAGSASDYAIIVSGDDADLTCINVDVNSAGGGIAVASGANATFNSGSVYVNSASTSGRYLFYTEGEGSTITINGGNFDFDRAQNQKRAYIYASSDTTVYVNGGTFGKASTRSGYTAGILGDGDVIITGGTFGFDPSKWVADGYQAVKSGSTWTVSAIQ